MEYTTKRKSKGRNGSFDLYFSFQESRDDAEQDLFGQWHAVEQYHGYQQLCLSDYEVEEDDVHAFLPTTIKCPVCQSVGGINHGWRVRCIECGTWLECYGNGLSIWTNLFHDFYDSIKTRHRYLYKGKEVTEYEYKQMQMLKKLTD